MRNISVTIRGFRCAPREIVNSIGVEPDSFGERGDVARAGVSTILRKSFVRYEVEFEHDLSWDGAIDKILAYMGGANNIGTVIRDYSPEILHFSISIPVRLSEEQEDGFVGVENLLKLGALGASFGLSFP